MKSLAREELDTLLAVARQHDERDYLMLSSASIMGSGSQNSCRSRRMTSLTAAISSSTG